MSTSDDPKKHYILTAKDIENNNIKICTERYSSHYATPRPFPGRYEITEIGGKIDMMEALYPAWFELTPK